MPDPRTPERLRHHFEVERELALRLRASTREERVTLFKTLYTELFERVPDHPRLTRRATPEDSRRAAENQLRLIRPHLHSGATLIEIAPGDCSLGYAAAAACREVIGIDISDQREPGLDVPANFRLVVYDGYTIDVPDARADVAFSYQFLEHLHPDDVDPHFAMVFRLLKPGGVYVFDTPHRFSGPHDISALFGDTLQGFHFQEWTYREMRRLLKRHGFSEIWLHRKGRVWRSPLVNGLHDLIESLVGLLPAAPRRALSRRLFQSVTLTARKPDA